MITSRHTFAYIMGDREFTASQTPTPYLLKFIRGDGTTFYIGPKSAFEKASATKSAKKKGRSAKTAKRTSTKLTDEDKYLRASFTMGGKHVVLDDDVLRLHAQLDPNDTSVQSQFFVKQFTGTGIEGTLLYTSPGTLLAVTAPKLHGKKPLNVQPKMRSDAVKGSVRVRLMPKMTSMLKSAGTVNSGSLRADGYKPAAYLDPYNDDDDLFWWFGDKTTNEPKPKQICTVTLTDSPIPNM